MALSISRSDLGFIIFGLDSKAGFSGDWEAFSWSYQVIFILRLLRFIFTSKIFSLFIFGFLRQPIHLDPASLFYNIDVFFFQRLSMALYMLSLEILSSNNIILWRVRHFQASDFLKIIFQVSVFLR